MSSVGSIGVLVSEALLPTHECLWVHCHHHSFPWLKATVIRYVFEKPFKRRRRSESLIDLHNPKQMLPSEQTGIPSRTEGYSK